MNTAPATASNGVSRMTKDEVMALIDARAKIYRDKMGVMPDVWKTRKDFTREEMVQHTIDALEHLAYEVNSA